MPADKKPMRLRPPTPPSKEDFILEGKTELEKELEKEDSRKKYSAKREKEKTPPKVKTATPPKIPKTAKKKKTTYPWMEDGIRDDVLKTYNLRLPEPYLLKLKYIAKHTPDSMQQFCLSVIIPEIDKKIKEITE